MSAPAHPAATIHLSASPLRVIVLLLAAILFVAICAALLVLHPRGVEPGSLKQAALLAGVVLFTACAGAAVLALRRTGPVISIGPTGLHDRRLSTAAVPWDAVEDIETVALRANRFLVLHLDPEREPALPLTRRARLMARLQGALGIEGHWINAGTLRGGFPALLAAVERHAP